jgi:hypothetical protein
LLDILRIRSIGKQLKLQKVRIEGTVMHAEFADDISELQGEPFRKWLGSMLQQAARPFEFVQNEKLGIRFDAGQEANTQLNVMVEFLKSLCQNEQPRPVFSEQGVETAE